MGWITFLLGAIILEFSILIMFIYYCDDKSERLWLLIYLIFSVLAIVILSFCLNELKHSAKTSCKEYSVETIVTQFENKSDTTYVLHLKR